MSLSDSEWPYTERIENSEKLRDIEGRRLSNCPEIASAEDLIEAQGRMGFDEDRGEWAFAAIEPCGYHRLNLGTCVLKATHTGELVMYLEDVAWRLESQNLSLLKPLTTNLPSSVSM